MFEAKWSSGKTKVIRVPESIAEEVLKLAHHLDKGGKYILTHCVTMDFRHVTSDSEKSLAEDSSTTTQDVVHATKNKYERDSSKVSQSIEEPVTVVKSIVTESIQESNPAPQELVDKTRRKRLRHTVRDREAAKPKLEVYNNPTRYPSEKVIWRLTSGALRIRCWKQLSRQEIALEAKKDSFGTWISKHDPDALQWLPVRVEGKQYFEVIFDPSLRISR